MKISHCNKIMLLSVTCLLASCKSTDEQVITEPLLVNESYLAAESTLLDKSDTSENGQSTKKTKPFQNIPAINKDDVLFQSAQLAENFSDSKLVNVTAKNMSINDFIQYVYGDLLAANYLLAPQVSQVKSKVTLNLKENISQRRLFTLSSSVLMDRDLTIKFNDGVYLIAKVDKKSKSSTVVGMGRTIDTIPNASQNIMQIVPVLYGIKTSLRNTVMQLADVNITIDVKQSALFVTGDYRNVSRALELIQLLDAPANRGRHIGLVKLTYSSPELYLNQISTLLDNEGVPNSINVPENNNLVFVPLSQIGAVAVFSATKQLLERVKYWTAILDKPAEGDVKQYFVYHPKYARAQDIGESLTPLISAKTSSNNSALSTTARNNKSDANNSTGNLKKSSRTSGGSNDRISFVVDKRSNALIFYTTGTEYRDIVGLVDRLDVLPKQVMLDIVVAEVTLTDQFQYGVKWAINNGLLGNTGQMGQSSSSFLFDGGFSYIFDNGKGDNVTATLSQSDTNVKVLSNPSILVRDGVTATLDIGTDIAIVSAVTEGFNDNDRVTTATSYRKTGIKVSVTPTINAQGIVIMDIDESISNEVTAAAGSESANPNIFERNLTTAVVAESGQTIMLGGLIDEKKTIVENKVPLLGDIPLLGNLFKSADDQYNKTELVLMVTPRVIARTDQWDGMMSTFKSKLQEINIK